MLIWLTQKNTPTVAGGFLDNELPRRAFTAQLSTFILLTVSQLKSPPKLTSKINIRGFLANDPHIALKLKWLTTSTNNMVKTAIRTILNIFI